MFRTLYSKLALTLFVLLCLIGVLLVQLIRHSSELYQQEVAQRLNATLAAHIVSEEPLISDDEVNQSALEHLFHLLMVINPSIELYLLDKDGLILGYSAPEGKVRRDRVSLAPVERFLNASARFPLLGDDPRNPQRQKVFSAAPIPGKGGLQGYLYIILGSEQYDSTVQSLQGSYILRASSWVLAAAIVVALLAGLFFFSLLTRRLTRLSRVMNQYATRETGKQESIRYRHSGNTDDEIDALGKQFNRMADRLDSQLQELERMDALRRELVANISHDLRTPLTTLQGYLETLCLKGESLSRQESSEYVQIALSHSQRLSQLVTELFELAKLDSCETTVYAEPFSLAELVQDVAQKFRLRAEESGIRLLTEFQADSPMVYGDIAMMQRVLENLIENGLRHTPRGGTVTLGMVPQDDKIMVKVADTGCGIPESDLEHIFDRFYRVDKDRPDGAQSAGLGLAIAKRILELHGSSIKVQTQIDKGTIFSFNMAVCSV